jgi:hypothetical protein
MLRVQSTASRIGSEDVPYVINKLRVSPNPARSAANLAFNSIFGGNAKVSVINQTGSVVLNKIFLVNAGDNTRKLDVGSLANGVYFIKIQTGSVIQLSKLVISK